MTIIQTILHRITTISTRKEPAMNECDRSDCDPKTCSHSSHKKGGKR